MKKSKDKKTVVFQLMVLVFLCVECFALQDEVGNTTAPPSSSRSGLVKSPNPINTSGNLTVTGNVGGMSYFHGNIPYQAPIDFQGSLGTSDLSSFLRLTAPVSSPTTPRYLPQPYYLPSRTVSSTAPSALGTVLTYPSVRASGGTGEYVAPQISAAGKKTEIPGISPLYDYSRLRPLSYEATDVEKTITYLLAREKAKEELSKALEKAAQMEEKEAAKKMESTLTRAEPNEPAKPLEPLQPLRPGEAVQPQIQRPATRDVYEQMLQEAAKRAERKIAEMNQPAEQNQPSPPEEEQPSGRNELSKIDKETAEATIGIHKSFATQAKDKFNFYMRTAEELLKQGKYYHAVDAYTLAGIYKPDDPLAYAGKAHALFASGEYMSSTYFLAKAINIFPQYVEFKIDLNAMIPDKERLDSRIADIRQWADKTKSAELNFLLAYIYYQLDKKEPAQEAIKAVAEKIPDSVAVKALQQAIEKK